MVGRRERKCIKRMGSSKKYDPNIKCLKYVLQKGIGVIVILFKVHCSKYAPSTETAFSSDPFGLLGLLLLRPD